MRRTLIVVGIAVIAVVAVFSIRYSAIQKAKAKKAALIEATQSEAVIVVRTAPVVKGDVERVLRYTGAVEAAERVEVYSKIAGRITDLRVREGDSVRKDQVVAVVDPEVTGQKFEPFEVTAPLAGKVSKVLLDPGAYVTQMVPMLEIINDAAVKVAVSVLEKDYGLVAKGTPARVEFDALPGNVVAARITNTSPVVDRLTGTAKVEIGLDNRDGRLKTGMFARVQVIADAHKDVVLVPREATLSEVMAGFGTPVATRMFVVVGDRAQARTVTLGLANATHFEVLEGLAAGEAVVVAGQNLLSDGVKVSVAASES
jgi:membrane fusion protein (multidrug efflux system)